MNTIKNSTERILLSHGSGGEMMHKLISDVILKYSDSSESNSLDDAAELLMNGRHIAFSTDTFVVKPVFFPGGDIGTLAVSGTVNDLLMKGARPAYLSLGFVLEEGFPVEDLKRILESIGQTCRRAGVSIVTGDTKVVGRGEADSIFINTAGVGDIIPGVQISGSNAHSGDSVIVSGTIGRHGVAVMGERNGLKLKGDIVSDAAPLNEVVIPLLEKFKEKIHILRDPTRGGVATTLNEIARSSGCGIAIEELAIPVDNAVQAVCEILGFEPLYLPCEGRFLSVVDGAFTDEIISFLREETGCRQASVIGKIIASTPGTVQLHTLSGGKRIIDMPSGELLPRIC